MLASSAADKRPNIEKAFAQYGRGLYRYFAVRTGNDAHEADDLMQQLWVQAVRSGSGVNADEMEYWLKSVAKNLIRQRWRKRCARPARVPIADHTLAVELAERIASEEMPDEQWQRREVQDQLILALTELTGAQQELIIAHYFRQDSQASMAAGLGISERAVEGRLYRARQALRHKLERLGM
jgi:RNA polymerase sigma-70 factor (ECF subfamily)